MPTGTREAGRSMDRPRVTIRLLLVDAARGQRIPLDAAQRSSRAVAAHLDLGCILRLGRCQYGRVEDHALAWRSGSLGRGRGQAIQLRPEKELPARACLRVRSSWPLPVWASVVRVDAAGSRAGAADNPKILRQVVRLHEAGWPTAYARRTDCANGSSGALQEPLPSPNAAVGRASDLVGVRVPAAVRRAMMGERWSP